MKSVACKQQTLQGWGQCCLDHTLGPSLGALGWSGWWQRLHWSSSWDITTWFHLSRSCWSCLRTIKNHLQKFLENFPQPFSFLGQYKGKSTLSDLQEERQRKRLKAMKQTPRNWESTHKLQKWWGDLALTPPVFLCWEPCYFCWRYLCVGKTGCGGKGHNDLFRGVPAAFPCSVSLTLQGLGSQCSCMQNHSF